MAITLKLAPHSTRHDVEMVEVWRDGVFVASIYPDDDGDNVRLVSRYVRDVRRFDDGGPTAVFIWFKG